MPAWDEACARAMTRGRLVATPSSSVSEPDGCGIAAPLKLEAIVLPDGGRVRLEQEPLLPRDFAAAPGDRVRKDVVTIAQAAGGGLIKLFDVGGNECRGRNRTEGATERLSNLPMGVGVTSLNLRRGPEQPPKAPECWQARQTGQTPDRP